MSEGETGVGGGMGPRSALCAATEASDRQDDLTAGVGGEALGLGVWGPVHPVQPSSASPHLPETGSGRGAIGLALAGPRWVWAWTLGLMDLQLQENQENQSPLLAMLALLCPAMPESHGLRAPSVGTESQRA